MNRKLFWAGCLNVRDFGGLRTANGSQTKVGSLIRSDAPTNLTNDGWKSLHAYGIRTIVDLRSDFELQTDIAVRPSEIKTSHLPLEDLKDTEFWDEWRKYNCTPIYYRAFLERFSARVCAVLSAIAQADRGVLIHCGIGRDRTGLISLVILAAGNVDHDEIVRDYELSEECLLPLNKFQEKEKIKELLERENKTIPEVILSLVSSFDAEKYLRDGGLSPDEIAALRALILNN